VGISYEILVRRGIGPVRFGMSPNEAHAAMGAPPTRSYKKCKTQRYEIDSYHENSFQIFYDGDSPTVNFIEISSNGLIDAIFHNISVLQTKACDLVPLVSQYGDYYDRDPQLGFSYVFRGLDLALWRSMMPESDDDPDGQFFDAVGAGGEGYFAEDEPGPD
jgi:hypothetical protein